MKRVPLSVYWDRATWDLARSAYVTQLDEPSAAPTLVAWVGEAVRAFDGDLGTAGVVESLRRVHVVDQDLVDVLDQHVVDVRRRTGELTSRSAVVRAATAKAAAAVTVRHGRLLAPPAELARGPRPRAT